MPQKNIASNLGSRIASLALILLFAAVASAQTFRGTILGTVTDPNGALVAGAKVTAKNTSTGLERSTTTDDAGNYTVPELPIGPYEVRVEQTGFVTSVVSNVIVEVALERRVDVKLSVAGTETLVTIAPNVQVETTTNTLGGTITTRPPKTYQSTAATSPSFWLWFPARPAILPAPPILPARSDSSALTATAAARTTTCSTALT